MIVKKRVNAKSMVLKPLFKVRVVKAKKGQGSWARKPKHIGNCHDQHA